jgi:uncharacterized repeat protein (TIGR01451 family)
MGTVKIALVSLLVIALALAGANVRRAAADTRRGGPSGYDLALALDASPDSVQSGEQVTVTLSASNAGPGAAAPVTVEISTPEGTTFASASSDGATIAAPSPGGTGAVSFVYSGGLGSGDSVDAEVVFDVTADPGTALLFEASVGGPDDIANDPDTSNNAASAAVQVASGAVADVAVEIVPLGDEAGSGSQFAYEVDVENVTDGEGSAEGVSVSIPIPTGATFASVDAFGECTAPPVGGHGAVVCVFDEIAAGDAVAIEVTVAVTAPPGGTLALEASVSSASQDDDEGNDTAEEDVPVVASPPVVLDWEEPDADAGVALPPPRNLVVDDEIARPAAASSPRDAVVGYKIYASPQPGVVPGASSLLTTVPATQTSSTVPAAPSGSFFVVTATYAGGESAPSNEASGEVPSATVTVLKVKPTKITASGRDFTDVVSVFVDGIPFVAPAQVKKSGTKVIQKGALLTGQSLGAYLAAHPSVVVMFRNSNGGVTAAPYPR